MSNPSGPFRAFLLLVFERTTVGLLRLFLLVAPVQLLAQAPCTLVLSGTVRDEHDGSGLAYADVWVVELERGTAADAEGRYRLEGLCAGTYTLRVAHVGCEPVERRVTLRADMRLHIDLEHHAEELRALEVKRKRPDEQVGQAHAEVDAETMQRAAGHDLAHMAAVLPGVAVLRSGPTIGKPVIHGLSGNRVLVMNQGIRQEDQQWGSEHAPGLDPLSGDGITVIKGAAGVAYGADAIGGVLITEPAVLPTTSGTAGDVRVLGGLNGRGGGVAGSLQGGAKGLDGVGWRVQGSGRLFGDQEAPTYVLSNTGLREGAFSASAGWRTHRNSALLYYSWFQRELGILRAAHIGNLTDLNNAIASGRPWYSAPFTHAIDAPRQTMGHHLIKAEVGRFLNEHDRLVLTYAYQRNERQEYDIRRAGRSARPALDLLLTTHTADLVHKHHLGRRIHGRVGVSGALQGNTNLPGTGVRPLIPNYLKRTAAAFIVEHFPLNDRTELEAGARLEGTGIDVFTYDADNTLITPEHRFVNHALSIGLDHRFSEGLRLRANLSSAFRPPHVSELYSEGLHHGAAAIEVGDPTLGGEQAWKAVIDLSGTFLQNRLHAELTLHAAWVDGYIGLMPTGQRLTIRGAFPEFTYMATDAGLHGGDLSVRFAPSPHWALRSEWSMVRGRDRAHDSWLYQMPGDRTANTLLFTPADGRSWRNMELGLTSTVVFRQTRVPDGDFMDAPPTYHLLGLVAGAARPLGKCELRFGLRGENVFNLAYRDYLDRFRYFADARGADVTLWVRYVFGGAVASAPH